MRFNDHPVTEQSNRRANQLRREASPIEQKLWLALRQSAKSRNLKFRRQQPIQPYIVDFICMAAKLIIELDGMSHDNSQAYDARRDAYLCQCGYTVLRFANEAVTADLNGLIETILVEGEKLRDKISSQWIADGPLP